MSSKKQEQDEKLKALEALEQKTNEIEQDNNIGFQEQIKSEIEETDKIVDASTVEEHSDIKPNILNNKFIIEREELPQHGELYPANWHFAYTCPESEEVAIFSTVDNQDQPAIMAAIEEMINKNVIIYDSVSKTRISSTEICDCHKIFFMLKLREAYLVGKPINLDTICLTCKNEFETGFLAKNLIYKELKEKLIKSYDGRCFHLVFEKEKVEINFRVPTIRTSGILFKNMLRIYRNKQTKTQIDNEMSNMFFDKNFLLFAPYLFETGQESVRDIIFKYKTLQKDKVRYKLYLNIINKISLENEDYLVGECPNCGSLEETQLKFPLWKNFFLDDTDNSEYF